MKILPGVGGNWTPRNEKLSSSHLSAQKYWVTVISHSFLKELLLLLVWGKKKISQVLWVCDGETVLTAFCPVKEWGMFCSACSVSQQKPVQNWKEEWIYHFLFPQVFSSFTSFLLFRSVMSHKMRKHISKAFRRQLSKSNHAIVQIWMSQGHLFCLVFISSVTSEFDTAAKCHGAVCVCVRSFRSKI